MNSVGILFCIVLTFTLPALGKSFHDTCAIKGICSGSSELKQEQGTIEVINFKSKDIATLHVCRFL